MIKLSNLLLEIKIGVSDKQILDLLEKMYKATKSPNYGYNTLYAKYIVPILNKYDNEGDPYADNWVKKLDVDVRNKLWSELLQHRDKFGL